MLKQWDLFVGSFLPAFDLGRRLLTTGHDDLANAALARLDQIKAFRNLTFSLEVVTVSEVYLLHVDCDRHQLFLLDILRT